jgi:hemolysin activation/secretion protein
MPINLLIPPVTHFFGKKITIWQAACQLTVSVSMLLFSLSVAAEAIKDVSGSTGLPQTIKSTLPSNIDIDYRLPASKESEMVDDEAAPKIKVSIIRVVEIMVQLSDGAYHEVPFVDDVIASMIRDRLSQQNGLMSVAQLQALAYELNQHLKFKEGYLLAAIYLPAQKVDAGEVKFALLKGKLGAVRVDGNQLYDAKALTMLFDGQIDKVVKKDQTEENLLRLQDFPGLSAAGKFSQGKKFGYTDLTLKVKEERRIEAQLFSDNYGSDFTGNIRGGYRVNANNLLGLKDRLNLQVYMTDGPDGSPASGADGIDCCMGSIGYEWALDGANKFRMGVEAFAANYDVGDVDELQLSDFGFNGKTRQFKVYSSYQLVRSRSYNSVFSVAVSHINARSFRLKQLQSEDKVSVLDFSHRFDSTDKHLGGGTNFGNLQLSVGKLSEGRGNRSRVGADSSFSKLNLSLNRAQQVGRLSRLMLRFNGQYSSDKLVGVQQISLGGPSSVRAYPTGAFLADKAGVASIEYHWYVTDTFKPYLLVDYASARLVDVDDFTAESAHLGGYGVGMNWRSGPLSIDVTAARAFGSSKSRATSIADGGRDAAGRKPTQFFASLQYDF